MHNFVFSLHADNLQQQIYVLFDNESSVILGTETGSRYQYLRYLPTNAKLRRNLVMGEPSLGTRLRPATP